MLVFRVLLVIILMLLGVYTSFVIANHGLGLLPIFFGDIAALAWPGQFNLDFMCMLFLSGLWVSWRHQFTPGGLALGTVAFFGGAFFLAIYLLIESFRAGGDSRVLLIGRRRVAQ